MASNSYYNILTEMLKQQMGILPVTQFGDLRSKIQLNNISSAFESNNGIFTCVHPILSRTASNCGTAVFNIHTNKKNTEFVQEIDTTSLVSARMNNEPVHIKYRYLCSMENTEVNLSLRCIKGDVIPETDDIYFILNTLFGVGDLRLIEVNSLTTNVGSRVILESYIKGSEIRKLQIVGNTLFVAEMQKSPFLKTVYINEAKDTMCIFKEHVVSGKPIVSQKNESSKFELENKVKSLMSESNRDFDALIFEASDSHEDSLNDEVTNVILSFCVNINSINVNEVITLMRVLANWFGIYKFDRVIHKKLTHLDVI